METITNILKEATNDILTEESLQMIEEAFNTAVEEKAAIHVEKALTEQDEEHAGKLEKLLEAIDTDHTEKLDKVIQALNENHAQKLIQIVEKYETTINEEADSFKGDLVDNISEYLDVYLEEKLPVEQIQEAVENKRAQGVIQNLREALGVDLALAQDTIKSAVVDGKEQLDKSTEANKVLAEQNEKLTSELIKARSHILLEEKTQDLPDNKKQYMFKVLGGKSEKFINENFDYTLNLFDVTEEKRLEEYKKEAVKNRDQEVDRLVVEKVDPSKEQSVQEPGVQSGYNGQYMNELSKW